jgi:HEXXH motif-containing protein
MASSLWSARPDLHSWCATLVEGIARWHPDPSLVVERHAIVNEVERAAAAGEPWMAHPCINALTWDSDENRFERDVRFVTWVAAHAGSSVGRMTLDRPSWRWSPDGEAIRLPAGDYHLDQFHVEHVPASELRARFAIDVYCRSIGFPLPRAWPEPLDSADDIAPLAAMAIREISHALDACVQRLPECAAWAAAVTNVIVPLQHDGTERSSGSQADIPGLIHLAGLHGPVAVLEALVHESAHHHFTMSEVSGAFVDPGHRDLHPSPLRRDPRPLSRILLAVHALLHMVTFYDDAIASGLLTAEWRDRRSHLERQCMAGLVTLRRAWPHLTRAGRALVEPWLTYDSRCPVERSTFVPHESPAR